MMNIPGRLSIFILLFGLPLLTLAEPRFFIEEFTPEDGLRSTVQNIMQDSDGLMWFATWGGLCKYDGYGFKYYKSRAGDGSSLSNNRLIFISEAPDGRIYCTTYDNKLYLFDKRSEKFLDPGPDEQGQMKPPAPQMPAAFLGKDSSGAEWYTDGRPGVLRKAPSGFEKRYFTDPSALPESEKSYYASMHELPGGIILVSPLANTLGWYDKASDKLVAIEGMDIFSDFVDRQGNLWSATKHSLLKLSANAPSYSFLDRGADVRGLFRDSRGHIWESTSKGLVKIRTADGTLLGYLHPDGCVRKTEKSMGHMLYSILEMPDGTLFASSRLDGVLALVPMSKDGLRFKIIEYPGGSGKPLEVAATFSLFRDSSGRVWVASYGGGLYLMENPQDPEHLRFLKPAGYERKDFQKIRSINEAKGAIFVCTTDGLVAFDSKFRNPDEIDFRFHQRSPDRVDGLASNNIMKVFQDSNGHLCVLCHSGGISILKSGDPLSPVLSFDNKGEKDGLYSDQIQSVLEDGSGKIWIIQEKSLTKFDPENLSYEDFPGSFFQQDGEFSFAEALPLKDGYDNMLVATNDGLLSFNARKMKRSRYVPEIVFTEFSTHGNQLSQERFAGGKITLNKNERNFSISFSALDYSGSRRPSYAYRLAGIDDAWTGSGSSNVANYMDIPHGEYTFQVKSTNNDGVWFDNIRELSIDVRPTFWETPWATLLYILLTLALMTMVLRIIFYIAGLRHEMDVEQQMTDMKLRFFTDLSHELRTPLTLITGPLEEVLEDEKLSGPARDNLMEAKRNSDWMLKLISQILDFRKLQSGRMKVNLQELDVVGFVQNIFQNFGALAKEHHNEFSFYSDSSEIYIWADADKLEKIIYNLLSNAFKYTPSGKKISVRIKNDGRYAAIAVKDRGVGINEKDREKLFERFQTVGRRHPSSSTGIGLSLVKDYVDMLHGRIEVESEEGKGSTFTVRFPLDHEAFDSDENVEYIISDPAGGEDLEIHETEPANGRQRILVVEDNPRLRSFLRNVLLKEYAVIEAENGRTGLDAALRHSPDIIITDLMMPEMDGTQMIRQIKASPEISHVPIVILSAKATLEDQLEGLQTGVDDYITKPFSSSILKARIKRLLERREELRKQLKGAATGRIPTPGAPVLSGPDSDFLKAFRQYIEGNMTDSGLSIDDLASAMNMSRSVLYRKTKSLTGVSPIELVTEMRVRKAASLLREGSGNVADVAYSTGFADPKYFARTFKRLMGSSPSEYRSGGDSSPEVDF